MTFDLISGLHMQIQTWHPPLWLCTHAKYYVKSGLTNVLKNANKTKNMHLFSLRIANYYRYCFISNFVKINDALKIALSLNQKGDNLHQYQLQTGSVLISNLVSSYNMSKTFSNFCLIKLCSIH